MTREEEILMGLKWEAERNRRLADHRKAAMKGAARKYRVEFAVLAVCLVVFVALLAWWNARQARLERAAYLEGRFGLDHETAVVMAESEVR